MNSRECAAIGYPRRMLERSLRDLWGSVKHDCLGYSPSERICKGNTRVNHFPTSRRIFPEWPNRPAACRRFVNRSKKAREYAGRTGDAGYSDVWRMLHGSFTGCRNSNGVYGADDRTRETFNPRCEANLGCITSLLHYRPRFYNDSALSSTQYLRYGDAFIMGKAPATPKKVSFYRTGASVVSRIECTWEQCDLGSSYSHQHRGAPYDVYRSNMRQQFHDQSVRVPAERHEVVRLPLRKGRHRLLLDTSRFCPWS